jgi:hypothetical protein
MNLEVPGMRTLVDCGKQVTDHVLLSTVTYTA